ncbi:MAG TPA: Co2+/Mg2+ efflux protein ApaG [Flavobacteriia bacterium]|jgi:ApaG protein|nr:Co2+/Mg2+ efflux protein ApaG [Flavobacteriia bacterium]HFS67902.1 Co2+/Mg2+ efflux protein ApaG [Flavobacteriia bacterium]
MVQQITKGIKISVKTKFEGVRYNKYCMQYAFSYEIVIDNQSKDTVQLTGRNWRIFDSLRSTEVVAGEGVIGKKPILLPKQKHTYSSFSLLSSPIGAMSGFFKMINFTSTKEFKVYIPTFQLMIPAILN